uniref:Uncharacterized protein n=1 Tax=Siphoviridae sp. ctTnV63 TaxID=2825523 RepID=A0A8S5NUZ4_9CAUD|nr:MAG TPA: hypothetical protein [Siphoviridae sp. ctTnV63]
MLVSWKGYEFYFFLFPLAFCCWIKDSIYEKYYKSLHWNKARADRVLNKIILKVAKKDEKTNNFSFCLDLDNEYIFLKNSSFIDRCWIKTNFYTLLYYLITVYRLEGYVKIIDEDFQIFFTKRLDKPAEK